MPARELAMFDNSYYADPYAAWEEVRALGPVYRIPDSGWHCVLGYDAAKKLSRSTRLSTARSWQARFAKLQDEAREAARPVEKQIWHSMIVNDPPTHTRLRAQALSAFTSRNVERWRARADAIAHELIDQQMLAGRMDLVDDYAYRLTARVIMELLGIPWSDSDLLKQWMSDRFAFLGGMSIVEDVLSLARRASKSIMELEAYFSDLIAVRRDDPKDDFLSNLISIQNSENGRLSSHELLAQTIDLLVAGQETTTFLISSGILALLRNPTQMQILMGDMPRIEQAVDEFLRYDPPEQMLGRLATSSFDLEGTPIQEGDVIVVVIAAANRDPAVFTRPNELDVTRDGNRHLSFGFDRHTCLGAQVAKSVAQAAIWVVLERLPGLKLESNCEPPWIRNAAVRGLKHLRVCW